MYNVSPEHLPFDSHERNGVAGRTVQRTNTNNGWVSSREIWVYVHSVRSRIRRFDVRFFIGWWEWRRGIYAVGFHVSSHTAERSSVRDFGFWFGSNKSGNWFTDWVIQGVILLHILETRNLTRPIGIPFDQRSIYVISSKCHLLCKDVGMQKFDNAGCSLTFRIASTEKSLSYPQSKTNISSNIKIFLYFPPFLLWWCARLTRQLTRWCQELMLIWVGPISPPGRH